jgi:two-component system, NtrC family, sensor kinase
VRLKSLKVKIAITLALLLMASIGLTNFVLLRIIERNIIHNHFESGKNWIAAMHLADFSFEGSFLPGIERAVYSDTPDNPGSALSLLSRLPVDYAADLVAKVKRTGQPAFLFTDHEWGVFWKRSKYLAIGAPLPEGVGVVVIELGSDYRMLRNAQQVAMGYLFLNFLILFAIGFYRLNNLITRPILRFIKLTDNYRSSEAFDLFPEKQNDEFNLLSSSLNRMLQHIENDKKVLEQSIGEIEKAHHDLKTAQQEIIRAEKLASIGRLSAGIAHEIGNPVGVVLGYLGLLKTRSISPEDSSGMDYIERAEAEINRINNIIRQLLDFSRSTPAGFTEFSVHNLLYDTGSMLSQQPLMENIRLFFDFSASDDIIYADYHQLHQVMVNLIINAADAISMRETLDQGEIRLFTDQSEDGKELCIKVRDNGIGVSREYLDKVFDPFFTTKETGKGTGLGLYVSYMIIQRLGGSIAMHNSEGFTGSEIVIYLPLSRDTDKS